MGHLFSLTKPPRILGKRVQSPPSPPNDGGQSLQFLLGHVSFLFQLPAMRSALQLCWFKFFVYLRGVVCEELVSISHLLTCFSNLNVFQSVTIEFELM